MNNILFLVGAIIVPILVGKIVTKFIYGRSIWENIGLSFLFGTNLLTLLFFLCHLYLDIQYSLQMMLSLVFTTSIISCLLNRKELWLLSSTFLNKIFSTPQTKQWKSLLFLEKMLLLTVSALWSYVLISNFFWPLVDWDAIALYDYRAIVIADTGSLDLAVKHGYSLQYPLYTSLLHAATYFFGNSEVKFWYALLFIAYGFVFYGLIRRWQSRVISLISLTVLSSTPLLLNHSLMAYTNLPYSIFISLGYLYLFNWLAKEDKNDLAVGSLLIAMSTWVRSADPFWLPAIGLLLLGVVKSLYEKKPQFSPLIWIFLIWLYKQPWHSFVIQQIGSDVIGPLGAISRISTTNIEEIFVRVWTVTQYVKQSVLSLLKPYGLLLIISLLTAIERKSFWIVFECIFLLGLLFFIFLGTFIFSFHFDQWQEIPDSASRMSMVLLPISIYIIFRSEVWKHIEAVINKK